MSGKIMGGVFDLDLSAADKLVLLALADHADHEGRNIRPSHRLVAWKTGYSDRNIRRIIADLLAKGVLIEVRHATGGRAGGRVCEYRVDLSKGPQRAPYRSVPDDRAEGVQTPDKTTPDNLAAGQIAQKHRTNSTETPDTSGRLTVKERSREPILSPPRASSAIPSDFAVTKPMRDQLALVGVRLTPAEIDRGTAKFIAAMQATDERRANWPAAWLRWMLDEPNFTVPRRNGRRRAEPSEPLDPDQYQGDNYLNVRGG